MSDNLYESLRKENASLSILYKNAMFKMKKMQNEYESLYLNYLNENQQREHNLKNNYLKYQDLIQKQHEKEEEKYLEEINNLKLEINEKNKIIIALQKNNSLLKDKLSKNELIFHLKEKEYKKELLNKDRQLMKSSDIVKKNSQEVMEDIEKLKEELKYFQNKIYVMNSNPKNLINNNAKTISNISNLNYANGMASCSCNCHKNTFGELNKSFHSTKFPNLKKSTLSLNRYLNGDDNNDVYMLKIKIKNLNKIIKKKDEEILFWKNLRKDLYLNNKKYQKILDGFDNEERNNKYKINNLNFNTTNLNKNNYKRSYSQSSSHFKTLKKDININLVDSNINKPINNIKRKSEDNKK